MRMVVRVGETAMMMLLSSSSYSRSRSVVGDSDGIVLDGDNDDDVVNDNDVGSSVDGGSVDGGDDPHGLRFFRCHCRGDGSFSGVAIMMLLLSSLLLSCCRCCCHCHCRRRARPLSSGRVASMVVSETKDDDDGRRGFVVLLL